MNSVSLILMGRTLVLNPGVFLVIVKSFVACKFNL